MPLPPLPEPTGRLARIAGIIRGYSAAGFLLSLLIFFNSLQVLSVIVRPFSPVAFRKFNRFIANTWWGLCAISYEKVYGYQTIITGADVPVKENVIVLLNHQDMADVPVLFSFALCKKRLGDLKWFVKDVLKYFPGVGWGMLFLDCLFIKRNWLADKDHIHKVFAAILKYRVPMWLMIFAEGTRVTPRKLEESRKFAEKNGLTPTRHVLTPRTKGFVATIENLRSHLDAVYDITIGYVEGVPTLMQWTQGVVSRVHLHIRRFKIEDLPQEEKALEDWLQARFVEKDDLLDHYYKTGVFPD